MKKIYCGSLIVLLALVLASCAASNTTQLEATNQALNQQVQALTMYLTQQAATQAAPAQEPLITESDIIVSTEVPSTSPNEPAQGQSTIINSALILSGSGTLTQWTNKTMYPNVLFGAANVHMICDPNGTADGKMWIDKQTETAYCGAKGEAWTPWKQDITVGDHYIYSTNANDKYEFWTVGTTPFTIRNTNSHSDFIFMVNKAGIYTLSANLIKGEFNVYLTCQEAQNFNYKVTQTSSYEVVLNPATCMLIIRDLNQAKISNADIEVSFEFSR